MRGALTPPPTMLTPVVWIPLKLFIFYEFMKQTLKITYTAAPTTDRATDSPIPTVAHICGEVSSRNLNIQSMNTRITPH